jgi:hypothetical protein
VFIVELLLYYRPADSAGGGSGDVLWAHPSTGKSEAPIERQRMPLSAVRDVYVGRHRDMVRSAS